MEEVKKSKTNNEKKLIRICEIFNDNLELLEEYVISIDEINFSNGKCAENNSMLELFTLIKEKGIVTEENEKKVILFKEQDSNKVIECMNIMKKRTKDIKKRKILFRSALMSLVVYFEGMISDVFKYLINKNPESSTNNKQLTFKEIKELGSMDNAVEYLVEKEIESITRGDYNVWCTELKNKFKFELNNIKDEEELLVEIIKRRNLFVHNNGFVNNIYLRSVDKKLTKGIKKNDILEVDINYIKSAIKVLKKVGNDILIELLKKNDKKSDFYWDYYFDKGYDELVNENYFNSAKIFEVLCKDKNRNSEDILRATANLLLSKKLDNKYNEIEDEINKIDISALQDDFKIVFLLIKGEQELALNYLKRAYPNYITKENIYTWPVFKEIRNSKKLKRILISNSGIKKASAYNIRYKRKNELIKSIT